MPGKRRQVLQMGSASKLHRYGYSKEFHSKDKKGKGTVTSLVGDFSDTDSEDNGEFDEPVNGDAQEEEEVENVSSGLPTQSGDAAPALPEKLDGSAMPENPLDMDDELKNFLSEIEAIPVPINGNENETPLDPEPNVDVQKEAFQEPPKPAPKAKPSNNHYSMFVKGESEFVHSPKATENSHIEPKEEDFPDEPTTNWQMVQDENTEYYYYWNTATNEVTWEIPTDYTQFLLLHREYVEKIAKYTPEQRDKLKEKHAKAALKNPGVNQFSEKPLTSRCEAKPTERHSLAPAATHGPERRPNKALSDPPRGSQAPPKSLSPVPETAQESKHKHKKEKRSHHKKKHKRKHGDQLSDEEKHSPKTAEVTRPLPPSQSSATIVPGYKLLSIVPYLSDQDDSDEDENQDPVPRLGPVNSSIAESTTSKESVHSKESIHSKESAQYGDLLKSGLSPKPASTDTLNLISSDAFQPEVLSQKSDAFQPEVLSQKRDAFAPELLSQKSDAFQPELLSQKSDAFQPEVLSQKSDAFQPEVLSQKSDAFQPELLSQKSDAFQPEVLSQKSDAFQPELLSQTTDVPFTTSLLLLPPPPPPPSKEDTPGNESTSTQTIIGPMPKPKHEPATASETSFGTFPQFNHSTVEKSSHSAVQKSSHSTVEKSNLSAVDKLCDKDVNDLISAIVDPIENKPLTEIEPEASLKTKQDPTVVETYNGKEAHKRKHITKEVIDMFAEHFPLPVQNGKVDVLMDKGSGGTGGIQEEATKTVEPPEEMIEEGEILEVPEKEIVVRKEKHTVSGRLRQSIPEKARSGAEEAKTLKSVNIVGYASDDEEEEGEVREKVVKKEVKRDEKLPSHKEKKKKDKKREQKKHGKSTEADLSKHGEKKIDGKTISQTLPQVVSQVPEIVTQPERKEQDDDDVEFDLDDIDRALEVALEKKLDKKKGDTQAKVSDKEMKMKDEATHSTASLDPTAKQAVSNIASSFDTKEINTDKDSLSEATTKNLPDSVSKVETDDSKYVTEIKAMAELALNKLEFLDISTDNLSQLQVLFIELQTRHTDWTAGGLSTQYFYNQLKIAEGLLEQYELSAVPCGWACQWDRDNNRYYYRNVLTNRIQWEYPDVQSKEKEEPEVVTVSNDASAVKVRTRGSEEHRRSRGSGSGRSKKNEEKEKCKHDRRSSSRHYHRKRRRGRDQSNSSNSSADSQQRRRHRKSKKKKKQHRVERSPSVEIVECIDMVDVDEIEDSPNNRAQPDSPIPAATLHSPPPRVPPDVQDQLDVTPAENPSQPPVEASVTSKMDQEAGAETTGDTAKETAEILNPVVISKPPQIIIPSSSLTGGLNVDGHLPSDHYPDPQVVASAPVALYPPYAAVQPVTDVVMPPTETPTESSEASLETDKGAKKKKKDKKSLATGSSIMMKKKHMSTMVQKWQKVKIEVEKEDLAKELRQAAIRKKIEEL